MLLTARGPDIVFFQREVIRGRMTMKFGTIANPQQVAVMARVVSAYCKHAGIEPGSAAREDIATKILALHEIGVRNENDLLSALIVPPSPERADDRRPGGQPSAFARSSVSS